LEQVFRKTSQKPGFSLKSKEVVPKTEVLKRPYFFLFFWGRYGVSPVEEGTARRRRAAAHFLVSVAFFAFKKKASVI
jgi:hypothetical protein